MGLKKIAEMRKELQKQADALRAFTSAAGQFIETHAKIAAAYEQVEKLRQTNLSKVNTLDTLGIKEFEDYKKSLVAVYSGWGNRPLPVKPLEAVVERQRKAVDDAVHERVAKLAASFPSQVKPGMLFRFEATKLLWEITSDAQEATNPNLKGDDRTWFKYVDEKGNQSNASLSTLKKSCKYIRI
jgi:hypothetical protein